MERTAKALALATALFLIMQAGLLVNVTKANFTPLPELPPPIYIRSDGRIEPTSVPLQRVGNTYTFTGDIYNTIEIQRSNIKLNGNGYTLTKPSIDIQNLMTPIGWLPGVHVADISNATITHVAFEGCVTGVTIENSSNITISHNTIKETLTGIVVSSSSYVSIVGNDITLTNQSFATGIQFLPGSPQESVPHHIRIEANRITGNSQDVPNNAPQPEEYGIWGGFADSEMTKNTLANIKGIALYNIGLDNRIVGNNFQENHRGILINTNQDVWFGNFVFGNNFNHNSENVVVAFIRNPPVNFWYNGTVGNYWSDYTGVDSDGDGIGDTPYAIETVYYNYELERNMTVKEGEDRFPLMNSVTIPDFPDEDEPTPPTSSPSPEPTPEPEPFPTTLVIGSVAVVAAVGLGLLVYFKKRPKGAKNRE